ncbi:MAG: hypothetical protein ACJ74Q_21440 [Pyrinomonadaceae bacterium]
MTTLPPISRRALARLACDAYIVLTMTEERLGHSIPAGETAAAFEHATDCVLHETTKQTAARVRELVSPSARLIVSLN